MKRRHNLGAVDGRSAAFIRPCHHPSKDLPSCRGKRLFADLREKPSGPRKGADV